MPTVPQKSPVRPGSPARQGTPGRQGTPARPAREVPFDELVTGRGRHRDVQEPAAPASALRRFALRVRLVQTPARLVQTPARPSARGAAR